MSRYELSVICQSAPSATKAPTADLRISSGKLGAPSMIRTCDLLVRRLVQVLFLEGSSSV